MTLALLSTAQHAVMIEVLRVNKLTHKTSIITAYTTQQVLAGS